MEFLVIGVLIFAIGVAITSTRPEKPLREDPASVHVDTGIKLEMNEGDMHSGPFGCSPNMTYPEPQYGSGFDEGADWNQQNRALHTLSCSDSMKRRLDRTVTACQDCSSY